LILLASDPDREGEAISWHVLSVITAAKKKRKTKAEIEAEAKAKEAAEAKAGKKKRKTKKKEEPEEEIIESVDLAALKGKVVKRVVFHEITESAVKDAFNHARELDMNLVDAQQARRVLDRLVGFDLSGLLWKKVQPNLSAGRVQSVAVRLIVEKEKEINAFGTDVDFKTVGTFENKKNIKKNESLWRNFIIF
jgi:DNA topoisomerase-1